MRNYKEIKKNQDGQYLRNDAWSKLLTSVYIWTHMSHIHIAFTHKYLGMRGYTWGHTCIPRKRKKGRREREKDVKCWEGTRTMWLIEIMYKQSEYNHTMESDDLSYAFPFLGTASLSSHSLIPDVCYQTQQLKLTSLGNSWNPAWIRSPKSLVKSSCNVVITIFPCHSDNVWEVTVVFINRKVWKKISWCLLISIVSSSAVLCQLLHSHTHTILLRRMHDPLAPARLPCRMRAQPAAVHAAPQCLQRFSI